MKIPKNILSVSVLVALVFGGGLIYQKSQQPELAGATVLFPYQGGTGVGSTGAGNVNKCLSVSSVSPFTYTFSTCSAGSSTGITAFGLREGYSGTFNKASSLSFESGAFNLNFNGATKVGSLSLDWTNGPASRSIAQTISAAWYFNNGASFSGAIKFPTNTTGLTQAAGNNSTKIATTAYVDSAVTASNPAVAVQAATTAASDTSSLTYNNGVAGIAATFTGSVNTAITIDGYTFTALNQRLLVKNDTQSPSGAFNGVYYVTTLQSVGIAPILTRALDYDMSSDINNTGAIPVVNGTANANTSWLLTSSVTTVGTDPLTYVQFSYAPSDLARLSVSNTFAALNIFSIGASSSTNFEILGYASAAQAFFGNNKRIQFSSTIASLSIPFEIKGYSSSSYVNVGGFSRLANSIVQVASNTNDFAQLNIQNFSSGASASGDLVVTRNNGTNSVGYVDLGIQSSGESDATFSIALKGDAYLFNQTGNLAIGIASTSANTGLKFFTGGTLSTNERFRIFTVGATSSVPFEVKGYASASQYFSSYSSNTFQGTIVGPSDNTLTIGSSINSLKEIWSKIVRVATTFIFPTYTATSLSGSGSAAVHTSSNSFDFNDGSNTKVVSGVFCKPFIVDAPTASNPGFVGLIRLGDPITFTSMAMVASGGNAGAAAGWNMAYGTPGTNLTSTVFSANKSASTSTSPIYTSFTTATLTDGQAFGIKITSRSAGVQTFTVTACYRPNH